MQDDFLQQKTHSFEMTEQNSTKEKIKPICLECEQVINYFSQ